MPESGKKRKLDLMQASDLGLRLGITMVAFTYGGYWLDQWLGTSPLLLLLGAFIGFAGGTWLAVRAVNALTREGGPDGDGSA